MIFDDYETLQMYVEESLEHLADIENDLLAIEDSGKNIDDELVNKVFRAAHSIKGGAGFMGLNNIKELSHKLENVLGLVRIGDMTPDSESISILLKGFDKLRELIHNVEKSNDIDVSEQVTSLVNLTTDSLPDDRKDTVENIMDISLPDGTISFTAPQFDIDQAHKTGKTIYLVEYDLIKDIHRKNKDPMEVVSMLLNSGVIIQSKIDIESVGTLESEIPPKKLPFLILFASIMELEIISTLFEIDEKFIHTITPDMITSSKEQSLPKPTEPETVKPVEPSPIMEQVEIQPPDITPTEPEPAITPTAPEGVPEHISEINEEPPGELKEQPELIVDENEKEVTTKPAPGIQPTPAQTSLRVNVNLLDSLMTLAGELVLSRNQLLQGITSDNTRALETAGQRINMVTSELQEAIMRTRMQSISNVFNKFPRVVRDLSWDMKKKIDFSVDGKDVELDKTIIEAISDPLTHLVRNSVDHGIETPKTRRKMGKNPTGKIILRAFHEAGQVNIEISDDGKGLDGEKLVDLAVNKGLISEQQASLMSGKEKVAIIFLPGFSTAEKVTEVSGRGVGMDVVKTNLDKLGGIIDIDSKVGKGTTIRIKLPLTLAIIPSQIISAGKEKYAIPQVNLNELLRIPASLIKERIEKIGDADVVRLRGNLLPLLDLASVLEIQQTYIDPERGTELHNRRKSIADRRSKQSPLFEKKAKDAEDENLPDGSQGDEEIKKDNTDRRTTLNRRFHANSAINIAVVSAGSFKYGLVVDRLRDSEEIVVKPIGRHLKKCHGYAGATIMGDGRVALILDVAGLAQMAELTSLEGTKRVGDAARQVKENISQESDKERVSLLLFRNGVEEQFSVPLGLVERIERINVTNIENVGGKKVIQYRKGTLPLFTLDQVATVQSLPERKQLEVIIFTLAGREVGLMVTPPVDAVEVSVDIDPTTLKQPGIMGSSIINEHTTLMVDMFEIIKTLHPEWFDEKESERMSGDKEFTVLFAEDSDFFRNQVTGFLEDDGYKVFAVEDGAIALDHLSEHADEIDIVLTDIEMPNMDGFELTRRIKEDERFKHLRVIALTSLAGDEDISRGEKAGIDDYQIKLDREKLLETVRNYLKKMG